MTLLLRSAFVPVLLLILAGSASAQPEMKQDVLYAGITVGTTRSEIDSALLEDGWTIKKSSAREVVYTKSGDGSTETRRITYRNGIVQSISATLTVKGDAVKMFPMMSRMAKMLLEKRADRTERKGRSMVYYHTASDGSRVKTVWKESGKATLSMQATVL